VPMSSSRANIVSVAIQPRMVHLAKLDCHVGPQGLLAMTNGAIMGTNTVHAYKEEITSMSHVSSQETLAEKHQRDLQRTRSFISRLLERLEAHSEVPTACTTQEWRFLWGDETIVGNLSKLSTMLLKIIPLEQKLGNPESSAQLSDELSEDDQALLRRFASRVLEEE
jgi:hypothetical protein